MKATVSSTATTRTRVTSQPECRARPWHTPAIFLPASGRTNRSRMTALPQLEQKRASTGKDVPHETQCDAIVDLLRLVRGKRGFQVLAGRIRLGRIALLADN